MRTLRRSGMAAYQCIKSDRLGWFETIKVHGMCLHVDQQLQQMGPTPAFLHTISWMRCLDDKVQGNRIRAPDLAPQMREPFRVNCLPLLKLSTAISQHTFLIKPTSIQRAVVAAGRSGWLRTPSTRTSDV